MESGHQPFDSVGLSRLNIRILIIELLSYIIIFTKTTPYGSTSFKIATVLIRWIPLYLWGNLMPSFIGENEKYVPWCLSACVSTGRYFAGCKQLKTRSYVGGWQQYDNNYIWARLCCLIPVYCVRYRSGELWEIAWYIHSLIARFMGPAWDPFEADNTQVDLKLVPWTLLSGLAWHAD